MKENIIEKY